MISLYFGGCPHPASGDQAGGADWGRETRRTRLRGEMKFLDDGGGSEPGEEVGTGQCGRGSSRAWCYRAWLGRGTVVGAGCLSWAVKDTGPFAEIGTSVGGG